MKMIFKPLFITAALSAASLCFAISHAASIVSEQPSEQSSDKLQLVVTTQIYPITNQFPKYRQPSKFIQVFDKPLIRIPLTNEIEEHFTAISNKNSFYQMATIFNDKLQQLIAYFKDSKQISVQANTKLHKTSDKKTCHTAKHSLVI